MCFTVVVSDNADLTQGNTAEETSEEGLKETAILAVSSIALAIYLIFLVCFCVAFRKCRMQKGWVLQSWAVSMLFDPFTAPLSSLQVEADMTVGLRLCDIMLATVLCIFWKVLPLTPLAPSTSEAVGFWTMKKGSALNVELQNCAKRGEYEEGLRLQRKRKSRNCNKVWIILLPRASYFQKPRAWTVLRWDSRLRQLKS